MKKARLLGGMVLWFVVAIATPAVPIERNANATVNPDATAEIELEGILHLSDRKDFADGLRDGARMIRTRPDEPLSPFRLRVPLPGARSQLVDVVLADDELVEVAKKNANGRVQIRARIGEVLVMPDHPGLRIENDGYWVPAGASAPRPVPILYGVSVKPRVFENPWSGEPITKVEWVNGKRLATLKRLPTTAEVTAVRIEQGLNPLKTPLTIAQFPSLLASMKPVRSDSDLKDRSHAPSFGIEFETSEGSFRLGTYLGGFGLLSTPDGAVGWVTFDTPGTAKP